MTDPFQIAGMTMGEFEVNARQWHVSYSRHDKDFNFNSLQAFQKYCHIPESTVLGCKDKLLECINEAARRSDKKHFDFFPEGFCLPQDWNVFQNARNMSPIWILKP